MEAINQKINVDHQQGSGKSDDTKSPSAADDRKFEGTLKGQAEKLGSKKALDTKIKEVDGQEDGVIKLGDMFNTLNVSDAVNNSPGDGLQGTRRSPNSGERGKGRGGHVAVNGRGGHVNNSSGDGLRSLNSGERVEGRGHVAGNGRRGHVNNSPGDGPQGMRRSPNSGERGEGRGHVAGNGHGGHSKLSVEGLEDSYVQLGFERGEITKRVAEAIKDSRNDKEFNQKMEGIAIDTYRQAGERIAGGDRGAAESFATLLNTSLHTSKTETDGTGLHGSGDSPSYVMAHMLQTGMHEEIRTLHGSYKGGGLNYMNDGVASDELLSFYQENPNYVPEAAFLGAQAVDGVNNGTKRVYQDNREKHLVNFSQAAIDAGFVEKGYFSGVNLNIPANGRAVKGGAGTVNNSPGDGLQGTRRSPNSGERGEGRGHVAGNGRRGHVNNSPGDGPQGMRRSPNSGERREGRGHVAGNGHGGHSKLSVEGLEDSYVQLGFERGEITKRVAEAIKDSRNDKEFNQKMEGIAIDTYRQAGERIAGGDRGAAESFATLLNTSLHTSKTETDGTGLHGSGDSPSYVMAHMLQTGMHEEIRTLHGSYKGGGLNYMNDGVASGELLSFYQENPNYVPESAFLGAQAVDGVNNGTGRVYQDNREKHLVNFSQAAIDAGFVEKGYFSGVNLNIPANGRAVKGGS